jgi:hypothetical protein
MELHNDMPTAESPIAREEAQGKLKNPIIHGGSFSTLNSRIASPGESFQHEG